MSIKVLTEKGISNREAARLLGVSEGCVRYHRRRQATGAVDGRNRQVRKAAATSGLKLRRALLWVACCTTQLMMMLPMMQQTKVKIEQYLSRKNRVVGVPAIAGQMQMIISQEISGLAMLHLPSEQQRQRTVRKRASKRNAMRLVL